MKKKNTRTRSRALQYPKRLQQTQKRHHAIGLGGQLDDDAVIAHVHDLGSELVREDGDGLEVLMFESQGFRGCERERGRGLWVWRGCLWMSAALEIVGQLGFAFGFGGTGGGDGGRRRVGMGGSVGVW